MAKKLSYNLSNKRGLSTIVITVILIALSMAAVIIVWSFVSSMIKNQINSSESCFGNYDKIKFNKQYTCYEIADGGYNLRFSLSIGNIDVDKIIVAVGSSDSIKSYDISNTEEEIEGLTRYPSNNSTLVSLPPKNSGFTYKATGFTGKIDSIEIAAIINGNQCEISDSIYEIEICQT